MKKAFSILAIAGLLTACNSGNEGSDSIVIDSSRVADSTRLVDSLNMADTVFQNMDTSSVR